MQARDEFLSKVSVTLETLHFGRPRFDLLLILTVESFRYTSKFFTILQVFNFSIVYLHLSFSLLHILHQLSFIFVD